MPKYKKKPIIVDAMVAAELMKRAKDTWNLLPRWMIDAYENGGIVFVSDHISIGDMRAEFDDMVVCEPDGRIHPVKPDIFVETYDIATEEDLK